MKLRTNEFRVLDCEKFEDFLESVVVKDLEFKIISKNKEVYYSLTASSDFEGVFDAISKEVDEDYDVDRELQKHLNPNDSITIEVIDEETFNAYGRVITKNNINGFDLSQEISTLSDDMLGD